MSDEAPRRGRPRDETVDRRILDAAGVLLRDKGPAAVHIDAVAAQAGVARTTVYRRYRNRRELLVATLHRVADQGAPPSDPEVADRFRRVLERVRDVVENGLGRGGVAAVLTDADPEFTEALRGALSAQLAPLAETMTQDADQGLLRHDVDVDTVLTLAFGAYLGRLLRHGPATDSWLDSTAVALARAVGAD